MKKSELRKIIKEEFLQIITHSDKKPFLNINDWEKQWLLKESKKIKLGPELYAEISNDGMITIENKYLKSKIFMTREQVNKLNKFIG